MESAFAKKIGLAAGLLIGLGALIALFVSSMLVLPKNEKPVDATLIVINEEPSAENAEELMSEWSDCFRESVTIILSVENSERPSVELEKVEPVSHRMRELRRKAYLVSEISESEAKSLRDRLDAQIVASGVTNESVSRSVSVLDNLRVQSDDRVRDLTTQARVNISHHRLLEGILSNFSGLKGFLDESGMEFLRELKAKQVQFISACDHQKWALCQSELRSISALVEEFIKRQHEFDEDDVRRAGFQVPKVRIIVDGMARQFFEDVMAVSQNLTEEEYETAVDVCANLMVFVGQRKDITYTFEIKKTDEPAEDVVDLSLIPPAEMQLMEEITDFIVETNALLDPMRNLTAAQIKEEVGKHREKLRMWVRRGYRLPGLPQELFQKGRSLLVDRKCKERLGFDFEKLFWETAQGDNQERKDAYTGFLEARIPYEWLENSLTDFTQKSIYQDAEVRELLVRIRIQISELARHLEDGEDQQAVLLMVEVTREISAYSKKNAGGAMFRDRKRQTESLTLYSDLRQYLDYFQFELDELEETDEVDELRVLMRDCRQEVEELLVDVFG